MIWTCGRGGPQEPQEGPLGVKGDMQYVTVPLASLGGGWLVCSQWKTLGSCSFLLVFRQAILL